MSKTSKKTKIEKKEEIRKLYPTSTGVSNGDGIYYDTRFTCWEDVDKHIISLIDPKVRLEFIQKLFTYPPIQLYLSPEPFFYREGEGNVPWDIQQQMLKNRGVVPAEPFIVQNTPGFKEKVIPYLRQLSEENVFPIFPVRLNDHGKAIRCNLHLIKWFGETVFKGDINSQIMYYTYLDTVMMRLPESEKPPAEEDGLLRIINERVDIEAVANPYDVRTYAKSQLNFYLRLQAQSGLESSNGKQDLWKRKQVEYFTKDIPWLQEPAMRKEINSFMEEFGEFSPEGIYIFHVSKSDKINLVYLFCTLAEIGCIGKKTSVEAFISNTKVRETNGNEHHLTSSAWRKQKSTYGGNTPGNRPEKKVSDFLEMLRTKINSLSA